MLQNSEEELDEMQEIIDDFLVETDELINSLDSNLVKLESRPKDLDLLNEIFRTAHTIKGTSSFLGFEDVTTLTHKMEDIFNKLRKSEIEVSPEIMDMFLESLDLLKVLINNVRDKKDESVNLDDILQKFDASLKKPAAKESGKDSLGTIEKADGKQAPQKKKKDIKLNDKTDREISDKIINSVEQTIRVDVKRLDTLMNMMGELVLSRNSIFQEVNKLVAEKDDEHEYKSLVQSCNSINFITSELQTAVMKMRMQPVEKVFRKFPRLVRDLARDVNKKIRINISGENTEVDKSVIEEISDPLVHILRNSCDHGIESPEERVAKGKSEEGTIELMAYQEGSNIIIKAIDDGRGFDVDALRKKAVEKNFATENDIMEMPDKEVFNYIFEAGFSTAKKVTDVSGRGVGMDVVRTNIERINGQIELDSKKDEGTTVLIKLPLTLAIIQGLLVESDKDIYILPLTAVLETVRTDSSDISFVNRRPVLRLRESIIPVVKLNDILSEEKKELVDIDKPYIVVVGLGEKKLGIVIDKFLGQEEVVVKSLGSYLGSTEGITGATILGDGRIRLIVDLIGLFNLAKPRN